MGVWLARLSRVPYGSKEAWMLTGEDVRVRGQKRRMREEMTLTLTLTLTRNQKPLTLRAEPDQPALLSFLFQLEGAGCYMFSAFLR